MVILAQLQNAINRFNADPNNFSTATAEIPAEENVPVLQVRWGAKPTEDGLDIISQVRQQASVKDVNLKASEQSAAQILRSKQCE